MSENSKKCSGKWTLHRDGEFTLTNLSPNCGEIIKAVNPRRGTFWKLSISDEEKKKLKLED